MANRPVLFFLIPASGVESQPAGQLNLLAQCLDHTVQVMFVLTDDLDRMAVVQTHHTENALCIHNITAGAKVDIIGILIDYGYKGYAATISILIFAVIMLVTVIQMIAQKKWVNCD